MRFIKQYDNHTLYVVEVVPQSGKSLIIKTMRIKPIRVINGQQTPNLTSMTKPNNGTSTSIDNSIPQDTKSVKSKTTTNKQSMQKIETSFTTI